MPYFERLLHHLKTVDDESALQDIQNITKAIIKLKFRLLPSNQKMVTPSSPLSLPFSPLSLSLVSHSPLQLCFSCSPSHSPLLILLPPFTSNLPFLPAFLYSSIPLFLYSFIYASLSSPLLLLIHLFSLVTG